MLLLAVVGVVGFFKMPVNLFPDSERPQVAVVTVWPSASAGDVAGDVSRVIEKELKTVELVRRVISTANDEVSVVTAEFEYSKGLDSAATDVSNSLNKIRPLLPPDIRPFQVYKVSSATAAVLTLAVTPRPGSHLDLAQVRRLAENPIKEALLRLPHVENVEVFGGYHSAVQVDLDPNRLQAFHLAPGQVVEALSTWNRNTPEGLVLSQGSQVLLKSEGEFTRPEQVGGIVVSAAPGPPVYLRDVADVHVGIPERLSAFHGNGKPAIGINIQRALSGYAMPTIQSVLGELPKLRQQYPGLEFTVADTQGELISTSVSNMVDAQDAIIMTVIVIFLFLADTRGMLLAGISIPFTYLITFAFMWVFGFEFVMVTLTGVILGVGMLLDDAIVVLENIERHYHKLGAKLEDAVVGGTQEVMLAILSGTYATVVVLVNHLDRRFRADGAEATLAHALDRPDRVLPGVGDDPTDPSAVHPAARRQDRALSLGAHARPLRTGQRPQADPGVLRQDPGHGAPPQVGVYPPGGRYAGLLEPGRDPAHRPRPHAADGHWNFPRHLRELPEHVAGTD